MPATSLRLLAAIIAISTLWASTASAGQDAKDEIRRAAEEVADEEPSHSDTDESMDTTDGHHYTVTFSPIHLFLPYLELMGEARILDTLGVGGTTGIGYYDDVIIGQLGVQANYYLVGDFDHGLQLGVQGVGLYGRDTGHDSISASARLFAVGGYMGYKFADTTGATFVGQLGIQHAVMSAQASDGVASAAVSDDDLFLLLNLHAGISF